MHGERYIFYCEECNKNLCDLCEIEHNKSHNLNNLRNNFFISNKILDNIIISKKKNYNNNKYIIDHPKSIFDELKFDKNDIKGLDYDEYLDDFFEEKNNNKIIKEQNIKIEKIFDKYKNKKDNKAINNNINKKPKEIFLNKKKENKIDKKYYEINLEEIYNKYKDSIDNLENNYECNNKNVISRYYKINFNE